MTEMIANLVVGILLAVLERPIAHAVKHEALAP